MVRRLSKYEHVREFRQSEKVKAEAYAEHLNKKGIGEFIVRPKYESREIITKNTKPKYFVVRKIEEEKK